VPLMYKINSKDFKIICSTDIWSFLISCKIQIYYN
jgi:hypothetical protein